MGIFIHLTVNPQGITPAQWEQIYQESLRVLQKFPLPLMRLHREEIAGQKRYVHTRDLVAAPDTEDEHWAVCGDLLSARDAEIFSLHRHFSKAFPRPLKEPDKYVLWAPEHALDYPDGNGFDLFGQKTQGYPYHLAILAVAIMVENRFPAQSYVLGDIDAVQAEAVMRWLETNFAGSFGLPLCLDGKRLYARLAALYPEPEAVMQRFEALSRDYDERRLQILFEYAGSAAVEKQFLRDLSDYSEVSQLGAIHLLSHFLSVTRDLPRLLKLVQSAEKFSLEQLLGVLIGEFITIEAREREPLWLFTHQADRLATIEDSFSQVFMTLSGVPSFIDFYLPRAEVLALFTRLEPEKRTVFEQVLDAREQSCREQLEKVRELMRVLEEEASATAPDSSLPIPTEPSVSVDSGAEMPPEAAYIVRQAQSQQRQFEEPEASACHFGKELRRLIHGHPELFAQPNAEAYRAAIYQATYSNGIPLRESAWQAIDREQNLEILQILLAFALLKEREMSFWRWRIYLMEHAELWGCFVEEPDQGEVDLITR